MREDRYGSGDAARAGAERGAARPGRQAPAPRGGSVPLGSVRQAAPSSRGYAGTGAGPAAAPARRREEYRGDERRHAESAPGPRRADARGTARASRGAGAQAASRAVGAAGRGAQAVARAAWAGLRALARFFARVLRAAVPFCARHIRAVAAIVAAAAVAVAVSRARGAAAIKRGEAEEACALAGAQAQVQALAQAAGDDARTLVEPQSTPKDQWAKGQMPYLYQIDPQWSHESYSGGLLRHQGCGPTALCMVYIDLTGKTDMDPAAMAAFSERNGFAAAGQGTSWDLMTTGAAELGLTGAQVSVSESRLRSELDAGRPVICIMGPGTFTSVGHFIVLEGTDGDGRAIVHDSNSWVRSQKTWDLALICREAKAAWSFTAA